MWTTFVHVALSISILDTVNGQSNIDGLVTHRPQSPTTQVKVPAAIPSAAGVGWSRNRRAIKDWKLSDIAIIATLDGSLHALERASGETRWTISSADATIKSLQHGSNDSSEEALPDSQRDTWIVEPIDDGCLYTFNTKDGLYKLPFGIKQLVENSPFTVPGDDKVYVGERKTTLYSIDPRSGNVLQAYGSGFGHTSSKPPKCPARDSLDELDDDHECYVADPNAKDILKIGRNTYTLTIFSGSETLWNVTYTEWVPNTVDIDLERQYANTFDGQYISALHDGKVIAHQTETNDAVWFKDLDAPAVRVYDVLLQYNSPGRNYAPDIAGVALVAQPLDPHFADSKHENYVDGDGSTYIGKTAKGDWFALSAAKSPLVGGAPAAKWCIDGQLFSMEDLLGVHTHNKLSDQQRQQISPGHLLTIGDATDEIKLIGQDNSSVNGIQISWTVTILLLLIGTLLALSKLKFVSFSIARHATTVETPKQVALPVDELPSDISQTPILAPQIIPLNSPVMEKELPSLPVSEVQTEKNVVVVDSDVAEQGSSALPGPIESPKPKRKRGSRGGRKVREASLRAAEEEAQEIDLPQGHIVKKLTAVPLSSLSASGQSDPLKPVQIGALIVTDEFLGSGSHGTIVYKGTFEGRDVAVKRMLLDFYDIASHEVGLLQESDDHPNVIRYYCKQEDQRFLYIALERCAASLAEVTERPHLYATLIESMNDPVSVIQQMALGVQYLHSLKIVHRDLKPQNILVNPPKKSLVNQTKPSCARLVISDFGLCKKLDADQSSFRATTAQAAGTSGWRAPELLMDDVPDVRTMARESETSGSISQPNGSPRKVSRAIDIFSLGCVFYYVLSNGHHPFGEKYMREANIIQNKFQLDHLDIWGDLGVLARDLIGQMILPDPRARPDATTVLQHPFFWSPERRLNFLLDVSDRFEIEERDPPSPLLCMLESKSNEVVQGNWYALLDKTFIDNLGQYRKYKSASILDLLRALRNKKHHYQDLPENVQNALGPLPAGFLNYFCSRFPLLLLHTYYLAKQELASEAMFNAYFC